MENKKELVKVWLEKWKVFKTSHPRVAKRFEEKAREKGGLEVVFKEMADFIFKDSRRTRVQVPLTWRLYRYYPYGMSIKFYYDGSIIYARGIISSSVYDLLDLIWK